MKIQKKDSNYDIEVSAEEITSLAGLLKNDNAMELISSVLRYFQIQTDRKEFEEHYLSKVEAETGEDLTEIIGPEPGQRNIHGPSIEQEGEKDPGYFVGIPSNGSKKI